MTEKESRRSEAKAKRTASLEDWLAHSAGLERGCGKRAISTLLNELQQVEAADVEGASMLVQATVARLLSAARTGTDHLRLLRAFAPAVVRLGGLQGCWLEELEGAVRKGMAVAAGDKAVVQHLGPWMQLLSLQAALRRPCDAAWQRVEQYKKLKGVLQVRWPRMRSPGLERCVHVTCLEVIVMQHSRDWYHDQYRM
jgi:hypothetical protein